MSTRRLANDDPVRRERGRQLATGHTWDEAARRHLDFYRTLRPRRRN
ncbi:hypothetical protein [Streptomyces turgidiscabies]|uniref:Uncharacterized protein n=1 Tax=Streptomyces turgidiscabies TaxID=85558 RepID=A0ABU0RSA5_9ACTN|nr:hypothetical protein [Streptomyces turgidiscabies]MDQ0934603.1 hypothetical protein [Streptomyces turgidiscabies]